MPETRPEGAGRKARLLQDELKRLPSQLSDFDLPVIECSMGVAAFPQHGDSEAELLKAADAALYRAKEQRGRRIVGAG